MEFSEQNSSSLVIPPTDSKVSFSLNEGPVVPLLSLHFSLC